MTSKFCVLLCLVISSIVSVFPLRLPVNIVSYRKSLIGRQSSATRCFAASGFIKARALLTGIVDVSNVKDYSREINLDDAANLLRDRNYIYNIALAEAHGNATECKNNFTETVKKARIFMANRDEVWDREELKGALLEITAGSGNFVCLLGGKSTGKSLILRCLENRNMGTVFVINLRIAGDDILKGLLAVLEKRKDYYLDLDKQKPKITAALQVANVVAEVIGKGKEYTRFLTDFNSLVEMSSAKQPLEILINELIRVEGEKITIIIDEANIAFTIEPDIERSDIKAASAALRMFTQLTKETGKLNVILASSEHAFPYRLGDRRLGFNTMDLTGFIFAGEVPPDKMYELLTTKWGVGQNLAATLIDHYGGHVYDILLKLEELKSKGETFRPGSQMQADSVQMCLDFDGNKLRMRELLTQIAVNGFAPITKKTDREAEVISKYNVGGLVQLEKATVIGLPDAVWGKNKIGLIPSKQSIRLVIAEVLEDDARVGPKYNDQLKKGNNLFIQFF